MREFTKTEIDLCKKIAEKEKRKLGIGDYLYDKVEKCICLVTDFCGIFPFALSEDGKKQRDDFFDDDREWFPLWQEHNCLGWLRERNWVNCHFYPVENRVEWNIVRKPFKWSADDQIIQQGETRLEALLRAVLAVMEDK